MAERTTEELIAERMETHGDAYPQMTSTGRLWGAYLVALGWVPPEGSEPLLAPHECDTIMLLNKISRSAHGDPTFADHWDDLSGYAALAKDHARRG